MLLKDYNLKMIDLLNSMLDPDLLNAVEGDKRHAQIKKDGNAGKFIDLIEEYMCGVGEHTSPVYLISVHMKALLAGRGNLERPQKGIRLPSRFTAITVWRDRAGAPVSFRRTA